MKATLLGCYFQGNQKNDDLLWQKSGLFLLVLLRIKQLKNKPKISWLGLKHTTWSFNYVECETYSEIKSTMTWFVNNIVFFVPYLSAFCFKFFTSGRFIFFRTNITCLETNNRYIKKLWKRFYWGVIFKGTKKRWFVLTKKRLILTCFVAH